MYFKFGLDHNNNILKIFFDLFKTNKLCVFKFNFETLKFF